MRTVAEVREDPAELLNMQKAELREFFEHTLLAAGTRGEELQRLSATGCEIVDIIRGLYEAAAAPADPFEFDLSSHTRTAVTRLQELWNEGNVSPAVRSVPEVRAYEQDAMMDGAGTQVIIQTVWHERIVREEGPLGQCFGEILTELITKVGRATNCDHCGALFISSAPHQRFCSESHRQLAYRQRKEGGTS